MRRSTFLRCRPGLSPVAHRTTVVASLRRDVSFPEVFDDPRLVMTLLNPAWSTPKGSQKLEVREPLPGHLASQYDPSGPFY